MAKKVTMSEIARQLGVSTVTVSKALSGKDGVGEAMREKIQSLAAELGYEGKPVSGEEGRTVGVLISDRFLGKHQTFYWNLYERILDKLSGHGLFGMIEPVSLADESALLPPRLAQSGRVHALVVIGNFSLAYLQTLRGLGLPVVQADDYNPRAGLDTVVSDGYYGMYIATSYLIRRGHREIAYLGRVGATSSITDRYYGYCRALLEAGIPLRPEWVVPDRDERGEWRINLPEPLPGAFACNCDAVAYHLIRLLAERGLRVPEDVSVVCFDDFLYSELSSPRVTAYGVDVDGMAAACVDQLRRRWAEPDTEMAFRVVTGHLVEKESVRDVSL